MSTIGQRIRTIRKTNNLNQIKFANTIGISQGTLSELEQDKYRPSLDIIIAIKVNDLFCKVDIGINMHSIHVT
ncbi:helix-turn-helix transcriptional regulator [Paenibacillus peoriae]|uniref:Helix-turn-helix transcriptional regulator n=1 Tax=Paenibacillus peoriae TaxID=59893 RepID=A0A7H0Y785_9BACL|nr:helix-turn-helix transcriptional regulator [Paenibacillus peoriae]QNR66943.1 helix-turn-helix transcriptional regulator [Paenibacillus peoriae]